MAAFAGGLSAGRRRRKERKAVHPIVPVARADIRSRGEEIPCKVKVCYAMAVTTSITP